MLCLQWLKRQQFSVWKLSDGFKWGLLKEAMVKTGKIEEVLKLADWKANDKRIDNLVPEARAELAALKSTAEDLECLLGEAQVENKRLWEWVKALMSLTLGGSEYMDDPARCVAFIRRKEEGLNKAMKRFKDRADKARQEEREACAVIAATYSPPGGYRDDLCKDDRITTGDDIAERIRARGEGSLDKEELEGGEMSEHIKVELDFIPVGERLPEYQVRVVVS